MVNGPQLAIPMMGIEKRREVLLRSPFAQPGFEEERSITPFARSIVKKPFFWS